MKFKKDWVILKTFTKRKYYFDYLLHQRFSMTFRYTVYECLNTGKVKVTKEVTK